MQQLPLQLEQNDYLGNKSSGFRLQRYEVLNWGTFDRHVWKLDLQGSTALLTGANGSGKSTLVDGLLTLLVPNRGRNYNLASGDTGKRERDEKSYVRGAYDRTSDEDSYGSQSKYLREEGTPTVLLLYFGNADSQQKVTLAQVLWVQERQVNKFFVVHQDELGIDQDFNAFSNIRELKKRLRSKQAEVFDTFNKYSASFRRLLGLQSDKALDLFNQTVSIKEIKSLNQFVRNHMLEKTNVRTKITELQKSYEDLTACHNVIEQARLQLEALIPLAATADNYQKLKSEGEVLQQNLAIAPAYFAQKKSELLVAEINNIEQQLTEKQQDKQQSDRQLEDLRQQAKDLEFDIKQDEVGRRLAELKREIKQREQEVVGKKSKAEEYDRLAESLKLPGYQDKETFLAAREQGELLKQTITDKLANIELQRDELVSQRKELEKQQQELQAELDSLRRRKSQIPQKNLNIRDRIVQELNLDKTKLPFVGELLKVRDDAAAWEGAIERLLRGFGLCILVSDRDYQQVNTYVNDNDLKGRLVYYRVTQSTSPATQRQASLNNVPAKLEIKPDDRTFFHWLSDKLVQSYNYTCCDLEQFARQTLAITKTGLIKHGGERHEKDDSSRIGDRRNYILGWDNAAKIAAIEAELDSVNEELNELNQGIKSLEKKRRQRQQQQSWLQDFMNFTDFREIDWRSSEQEKQKLVRDLAELEASSDRLKQLEAQLKNIQQQIQATNSQRDSLIREIQTFEDNLDKCHKEQLECQERVDAVEVDKIERFAEDNLSRLRRYQLNLETIDSDQEKIISKLTEELRSKEKSKNESKSAVQIRITNFRGNFRDTTLEMGNDFDSLPEYIKLKNKIEQDDLPRHEKRFKEMMTNNVIVFISNFQASLQLQEEEITHNIDNLNQSLREIDYTDATYIELRYQKNRDREINDFRNSLKICLGDVTRQTAEDNEERFKNIQKLLIIPFTEKARWTEKVTDVRNWLDFSVSERDRIDNKEKSYYTNSSGLSGGQKAKLAFTILASAISYQFGLNQTNFSGKSFRFVAIDEAFGKVDTPNTRSIMNLFQTLNLQLLVITPSDKIDVLEPYISSLHFVHNKETKDFSSVMSMSISQFQQNRDLALDNNNDKSLSN